LVICEGLLNGQIEPKETLKHVSQFVATGGMLVITSSHLIGMLSEILRRILRVFIYKRTNNKLFRVELLEKLFDDHLKSLRTETRPIKDWVYDSIIHNWQDGDYGFFLKDTILTLNDNFEFRHSYPDFSTEGKCYKSVENEQINNLENIKKFEENLSELLDYRVDYKVNRAIKSKTLDTLCSEISKIHNIILEIESITEIDNLINLLEQVKIELNDEFELTKESIDDYIFGIRKMIKNENHDFIKFKAWWGRAQHYSTFVKI
jgi:hypothetical protein